MPLLAAALFTFAFTLQDQRPRAECREWHECRQLALDAAEQRDYERFHDFAWRAVQTGPKNDPDLMYLLARAQSLSGRPGDALVMLQRLAGMGVPTDAATNDDFRRVRALAGWADFAAAAKLGAPPPDVRPSSDVTNEKTAPVRPRADAAETRKSGNEAVRFGTLPFTPAGLAYDAVSRRFIVGDRRARRLAVIDEFSEHVANLASAQSAGFGDIVAIEINPRDGDLWVLSANSPQSTLHKLQLISGRSLASYAPADRFGDVDLVDVAVTEDGGVLVLDRAGHRLFHLRPRAAALELLLTLPDDQPTSIAPASDGVVYVSHAAGISRVDLSSRRVTEVKPAKGVDLSRIMRLRPHRGSLIAVQRSDSDVCSVIRVELDRQGHRAAAIHALDVSLAPIDPTATTISGGVLYYLAAADGSEMVVRKVRLK